MEENRSILNEKYTIIRDNYWSGLRRPINDPIGRNWMLFYCFKRITKNKCPMDCIMYLINEFLNWIPAGCWKDLKYFINCCSICKCGCWNGTTCSYECEEKEERLYIVNEWQNMINIIDVFVIQDTNEALEIMDDIEYQTYNTYIWYSNSDIDYDDFSDFDMWD